MGADSKSPETRSRNLKIPGVNETCADYQMSGRVLTAQILTFAVYKPNTTSTTGKDTEGEPTRCVYPLSLGRRGGEKLNG